MIDYDAELLCHQRVLHESLGLLPHDRVLDVGCGAGQSTRDAARLASDAYTVGIDNATAALRRARAGTLADGPPNVVYVSGDAACLPFPPASFDVVISRFGTMFFAEPATAFRGLRKALSPRGRLVMLVWQEAARNEWAVAIHRALVGDDRAIPVTPNGPSAFSLGDPPTVRAVLHDASFGDIVLHPVHEPVFYGRDASSALEFVKGFANVAAALQARAGRERDLVLDRMRNTMIAHQKPDGVWFDSRAWLVKARCR